MTGVRRATEADILMMFDLVECAREDFDVLPVGAAVALVNAVFVRYTGPGMRGRTVRPALFGCGLVWMKSWCLVVFSGGCSGSC